MALADYLELLNAGAGKRRYQETDPASPSYGQWAEDPPRTVGYQKLSAREAQVLGREAGSDVYLVVSDLPKPVSERERFLLNGVGELDVIEATEYPQSGFEVAMCKGELRT